jgi:hypothetical protein
LKKEIQDELNEAKKYQEYLNKKIGIVRNKSDKLTDMKMMMTKYAKQNKSKRV